MRTGQPKILEIPEAKLDRKKTSGKKFFENFGIPLEVVLFFESFGKCCSTRLWKLPKIQTRRFGWMGSAEDWLVQKIGLRRLLRLDAIKAEPSFLLLTQEEDRRTFSWQVVLLKDYNHGQKSWDTFAFLGRFPIHTGPTSPPFTPQTKLDACIRNFFPSFNFA